MTVVRLPEPLYQTEEWFAALVGVPIRDWPSLAVIWERSGFPKKDIQIGRRFVPAVEAWLLMRNGLAHTAAVQPTGEEHPGRADQIKRRARA